MKRLIICSDGTWQSLESPYATNVVKILQSILSTDAAQVPQLVYYDPGVGTTEAGDDRLSGGAFGAKLDKHIVDAYRFLALNWEAGDEIFLFGFSRGSYTVRSLAGMIFNCGLVQREHLRQVPAALRIYRDRLNHPSDRESRNFQQFYSGKPEITALCCFDTVGSLGIPDLPFLPFVGQWDDARYRFHDTRLSPIIKQAFHAAAIDEHRKVFDVTLMEAHPNVPDQLQQVWFAGDHSCIGGGSVSKVSIANIALEWMLESLRPLGFSFDKTKIPGGMSTAPAQHFSEDRGAFDIAGRVERAIPVNATLHPSVKERWKADPHYRPKNLRPFAPALDTP